MKAELTDSASPASSRLCTTVYSLGSVVHAFYSLHKRPEHSQWLEYLLHAPPGTQVRLWGLCLVHIGLCHGVHLWNALEPF